MPSSQSFWDKTAEKYSKSPVRDPAAYEATLTRVRAYLEPEDVVLELGCGTGTTALKLADAAAHITATDISQKMIEIAEAKRQTESVSNVRFAQATHDNHDFQHGAFDAVLAFNFLHLLREPEAAIREAHALLKPGGIFISKTVCLGEWNFFMPIMIGAMRLVGKAPYVRIFKTPALDAIIEAGGFEIIETGYYPEKARSRFVVARKK